MIIFFEAHKVSDGYTIRISGAALALLTVLWTVLGFLVHLVDRSIWG